MSTYAFFALSAIAAFVPLVVSVAGSRPWRRQERYLFLFLTAAIAWGAVDLLYRSTFLSRFGLVLGVLSLTLLSLAVVQLYAFVSCYFSAGRRLLPIAYASLAATVALAAWRIAEGAPFATISMETWYGRGFVIAGIPLIALLARAIYLLARRFQSVTDRALRGQAALLAAGASVTLVFSMATVAVWEDGLAIGHVGTMVIAFILSYAALEHELTVIRPAMRRGIAWATLGVFAAVGYSLLFVVTSFSQTGGVDLAAVVVATLIAMAVGVAAYRVRGSMSVFTHHAYWIGAADDNGLEVYGDDLTALPADERQDYEGELAVINRASMIIASSLDIQEMCGSLVEELRKLVDVSWASISLAEADHVQLMAQSSSIDSAWKVGDRLPIKGTPTRWVVDNKRTIVETDLAQERRFAGDREHLRRGLRSIAYLPLKAEEGVIGSFVLASRQPGAYKPRHIRILQRLTSQMAKQIEHSRLYSQAVLMARIDALTGLHNRRAMDEAIAAEIQRCTRRGDIFSLIILDIDELKAVNDAFGHLAGDNLLRQVADVVAAAIRSTDQAFRFGGDEFAVLLPRTTIEPAREVAERIRRQMTSGIDRTAGKTAASFGIASWPANGPSADDVLAAADRALYEAKRHGGNRSYSAEDTRQDRDTVGSAENGRQASDSKELLPRTPN